MRAQPVLQTRNGANITFNACIARQASHGATTNELGATIVDRYRNKVQRAGGALAISALLGQGSVARSQRQTERERQTERQKDITFVRLLRS